ncbi:hypothetical protein LCGC14_2383650, partial [marine sediment metagenome]
MNRAYYLNIPIILILCLLYGAKVTQGGYTDEIQPYKENSRYWQYQGEPVLLVGGTKDDNLFQIPDLEEHLNLLTRVGGNYIRNTMSARDKGNVHPFEREGNLYNLDRWNEEYWNRFERMLKLTQAREIIVQIELWAQWDFSQKSYPYSAWNPKNNVTFTRSNTRLKEHYGKIFRTKKKHDFFTSVPRLSNDTLLLEYQKNFVEKILSYSLRYGHVLYCVTNEIFEQYSPEWGWYWARYVKDMAQTLGKTAYVTEMFQSHNIRGKHHKASLDHPEIYDYVELSQNSTYSNSTRGDYHWDNLVYVHDYISAHPRPINHTKTYGDDPRAVKSFWRSIIGGAASMRFHRPNIGLGLNEKVQASLKAVRKLESLAKMWEVNPFMDLLQNRTRDEAYVAAEIGKKYVLYFPDGGSVKLNLRDEQGTFLLRWINIHTGNWGDEMIIRGGSTVS